MLGPLLWNIGYNSVLKDVRVPGCKVLGYADDTLIIGTGKTVSLTRSRVNQVIVKILRRLEVIDLKVAPEKTEAVLFYDKRPPDLDPVIRMGGTYIRMSPHMKYLGILLDSRLSFNDHFKFTKDKMEKVNNALCRLMPNLRGPAEYKRRLYCLGLGGPLRAPIWSDALQRSEVGKRIFREGQRRLAIRVCSAYRTTSYNATTLLARVTPLDLLAKERKKIYYQIREADDREHISSEELNRIRREAKTETAEEWKERLSDPRLAGKRTINAILPIIGEWMTRSWGGAELPPYSADHGSWVFRHLPGQN